MPDVDFTGLPDEVINWTNVTSKDGGSGGSNENSGVTESDEFTDATDTFTLAAEQKDTGAIAKGFTPSKEPDSKYLGGIGKTGTNYAEFVKGCKTACEVVGRLRTKFKYGSYPNNKYKDASETFDHLNYCNCADASRLLKSCLDVCGIPSIILHGHYHYFNAVKMNGKWKLVDLCFSSNIGKSGYTNTLGC